MSRDGLGRGAVLACSVLLVLGIAFFARVSNAYSDPRYSLLVSQALIEHGTVRLDAYVNRVDPRLDDPENEWAIVQQNGHFYYYFPPGPSFFSAPAVWGVRLLGKDMANRWHNRILQNILSALLCAAVFAGLYRLGREYLSWRAALVIALVSMLGSSLISTMGTALWNFDFAVLFIVLALLLIVRLERGVPASRQPYWLGILLFCIYFSRPSAATFIVVTFGYLLWRRRHVFLPVALAALVPLLLYSAWSWREFGSPAPAYYAAGARFAAHATSLWIALYGHLLSPARGLLIFSPFYVLIAAGVVARRVRLSGQALFWFALAWFGLHLAVVSTTTRWWGGWSFGPRLLTDALPALVLLTILLWCDLSQAAGRGLLGGALGGYLLLGLVAIFINSYQGLYNLNTARWNGTMPPDVDRYPEYLLDWRYPQFAATTDMLCARNRDFLAATASAPVTYRFGTTITHRDEAGGAVFVGWSAAEPRWRWSECPSAALVLRLGPIDSAATYEVQLTAGAYGNQPVSISVNGTQVGSLVLSGSPELPQDRSLVLSGSLLRPHALNELRFDIPGATFPDNGDPRLVGLAFVGLRLDLVPTRVAP